MKLITSFNPLKTHQNYTPNKIEPRKVVFNTTANKVWINDGSGNFTDSGQSLGNLDSRGVALGFLDGDDHLDAFVANTAANKVWINDGSGNFTDSGQSLGSSRSRDVALEDLDGDGRLDAFVANISANMVWINDGSANFSDNAQALGNLDSRGVALGDVDGDGDPDAIIANYRLPEKVWLNDGDGNFSDSGQHLGQSESEDVALGVLNADTHLDAFTSNRSFNTVYMNTVTPPVTYDANGQWTYSSTNNWADSGCDKQNNRSGVGAVSQTGNSFTIVALGIPLSGDVREADYSASGTFNSSGGKVTLIINFTLTSAVSGSGFLYWYWTDGDGRCFGGSDFTLTSKDTATNNDDVRSGGCFISTVGF